jgi:tRNA threonylcarbamoyl adenosine modification protein YjeE
MVATVFAEAGALDLRLPDDDATARLGDDIAAVIRPGDLVGLSGGLGAGKTSLARALIRAVADDPAHEAPSPTFPIRIDHELKRLTISHVDLYRLGSAEELEQIGIAEALERGALLVEWPELLPPDLSDNRLDIRLDIAGAARHAAIAGAGTWPERLARTRLVRGFLDRCGWREARRAPLVGDASYRAYERVSRGGDTAILMNAPERREGPAIYEGRSYDTLAHRARDVRPFVAIAGALREAGVRVPAILAADLDAGLLLLEDIGEEGILDVAGRPILERYAAAVDLLAAMHGRTWSPALSLPDGRLHCIPPYDRGALLVELSLFPDWIGGDGSEPAFPRAERDHFLAAWADTLAGLESGPTTLVMRDFHSPNILWQPHATGLQRVGVLDFQDALMGHPAYDVASLAQDARAPLSEDDERFLTSRYKVARQAADPDFDTEAFEAAYEVFAAQRATKVLGAFTRLALVENKPGYRRHRARLKELLRRTLAHPVLSRVRLWYEPYV